jgi:hypothetical protein
MKASWRAGYSCIVYLDVMDDQELDEAKLKLEYFLIMGTSINSVLHDLYAPHARFIMYKYRDISHLITFSLRLTGLLVLLSSLWLLSLTTSPAD